MPVIKKLSVQNNIGTPPIEYDIGADVQNITWNSEPLKDILNDKQDKLIAGSNIVIAPDGRTISAIGGGGGGGENVFAGESNSSGTNITIDTNIDLKRDLLVNDIILVDFINTVYRSASIIIYNNDEPIEKTIDGGMVSSVTFYDGLCGFQYNGFDFDCLFKNIGYTKLEGGTGIEVTDYGDRKLITNTAPMKGACFESQVISNEITNGEVGFLNFKDPDYLLLTFNQNATIGTSEYYLYRISLGSRLVEGSFYIDNNMETYFTEDIDAGSTLLLKKIGDIDESYSYSSVVVAVFGNATKADIATLQSNFQDGVDTVYNACVAKGSTPESHALGDVVTAIGNIETGPQDTIHYPVLVDRFI